MRRNGSRDKPGHRILSELENFCRTGHSIIRVFPLPCTPLLGTRLGDPIYSSMTNRLSLPLRVLITITKYPHHFTSIANLSNDSTRLKYLLIKDQSPLQ